MLEIITEFRKGIFFVRLGGELTKNNYLLLRNEVSNLVKDNQIRNIVFNLENVFLLARIKIVFVFFDL